MSKFDPYEHMHLKLNPDGSITRLFKYPTADPKPDPASGEPVLSKDVIFNAEKNTTLRIYFPIKTITSNTAATRLPILFYFHGCSWILFPANNIALNREREKTALTIPAIIILVNYRLSPESRLPGPYEDVVDALLWLKNQALDQDGEEWLKNYGDFSRCFLSGSSNGGNMVFHAAFHVLDLDLAPLKLAGLIINQPLFGGKKRTISEIRYATDQITPLPVLDAVWELALPKGVDRDHPFCNPMMMDEDDKSKLRLLPRCLVMGFGMNPLTDRQEEFVKMLVMNGVLVEAHFDEVGFHRIELVDPARQAALLNFVRQFIHSN